MTGEVSKKASGFSHVDELRIFNNLIFSYSLYLHTNTTPHEEVVYVNPEYWTVPKGLPRQVEDTSIPHPSWNGSEVYLDPTQTGMRWKGALTPPEAQPDG